MIEPANFDQTIKIKTMAVLDREFFDSVCVAIQSPEKQQRQSGLKRLLTYCESPAFTEDIALDAFDLIYLHVLKCYGDQFERTRALATSVVSEVLKKLPRNDFYLNYIIPAISRRIGRPELVESSEELRLQWLEQLDEIVELYRATEEDGNKDCLLKNYNDFVDILKKTLTDPYPAAHRKSCAVVKSLARATPSFHYQSESFVKPLISMLKHKQSASRCAAIETLGIVCQHLTTNTECILNVIGELCPMLLDSVPFVRRECGRVGCNMMLHLRDRYSMFDKILPLVLGW